MPTAGPIGSLGGAFKSPCAHLKARFADGPRRQRPRIAQGQRLIEIVEPRRCRWRIERAGAARVLRDDIVERVADGEILAAAELVIELAEKIHRVDRIRIAARRDGRSRISRRSQPRVDRGDVLVRDRSQACLVENALLDVREIERPIAGNRSTHACAPLFLTHLRLGRSGIAQERVVSVHRIVTEICVDVAAWRVRAALGNHAHIAAERAAQLRVAAGRDDLKLIDRIDAVRNAAESGRVVVCGKTVDDEVVGEVPLAANGDALSRHR